MSKGTLKVTLLNVSLQNAQGLTDEQSTVEFRVGVQKSTLFGNGKAFKSNGVTLFTAEENGVLEIYVYPKNGQGGDLVVYGEVKLHPLLGIPNTKHIVTVHSAYKEKAALKDENSGTIQVEIVYYEALDSVLQINVESAKLFRDTEAVGKMDPYVEVQLDDTTQKTSVKQEAGKEPVWNQTFFLNFKDVHSKLILTVKDQDVTTSDLVGSVELSLRDTGILSPSSEWVERVVEITYKDKVSGTLNISTRFTINDVKK